MRLQVCGWVVALIAAASGCAADFKDIEYSRPDGKPLLLDAKIPDGKGPFPTAIIVHGGSWTGGNKGVYIRPLKPVLEQAGYGWFSIDYRLGEAGKFPANVTDVQTAVAWVRAHAKQYHVDKKRIALIGESAGGHLVAMVGAEDKSASHVAAVVDFYGPNDMRTMPQQMPVPALGVEKLIGATTWNEESKKTIAEASPIVYVHKGMPPFLFIHGTKDTLVPFQMSPVMCEAMKKLEASCQVVPVEGGNHGMESWEGKPGMEKWKPVMIDWLNKTLKVRRSAGTVPAN